MKATTRRPGRYRPYSGQVPPPDQTRLTRRIFDEGVDPVVERVLARMTTRRAKRPAAPVTLRKFSWQGDEA